MKGLLAFGRAIDAMSAAAGKLADWLVLFACLISAGNAGVRYIFSYSSNAFPSRSSGTCLGRSYSWAPRTPCR